jgi:hypothetical protein
MSSIVGSAISGLIIALAEETTPYRASKGKDELSENRLLNALLTLLQRNGRPSCKNHNISIGGNLKKN